MELCLGKLWEYFVIGFKKVNLLHHWPLVVWLRLNSALLSNKIISLEWGVYQFSKKQICFQIKKNSSLSLKKPVASNVSHRFLLMTNQRLCCPTKAKKLMQFLMVKEVYLNKSIAVLGFSLSEILHLKRLCRNLESNY